MSKLGLAIVVDDAHLTRTEAIARSIGAHGLSIERVVPEAGAIYATGDSADIDAVRRIEGVLGVEEERPVILPPRDARIPQ